MRIFVLLFTLLLSACGFHLRGQAPMPFGSMYIQSANGNAPLVTELKHALAANGVQIADSSDQAELTLHIVSDVMDKQILSLSGSGHVLEYQLNYHISLRAFGPNQQDWIAPAEITLQRDFPYDDTQILAKAQEEALLYRSMRSDVVQQVLRRLVHAKPPQPEP